MSHVLDVTVRETLGTRNSRRLRKSGQIPAVLYGHKQQNVHLVVGTEQAETVIRHGTKMVNLRGAATDSALVRDVQWDAFGAEVLHLDLERVDATEKVDVAVPIALRGDAPGIHEGGQVQQLAHEVRITCQAGAIPERFTLSVNQLHVGGTIVLGNIELPPDAELLDDPETLIAHCVEVTEVAEEAPAVEVSVEPEVIGRKAEEGDEQED